MSFRQQVATVLSGLRSEMESDRNGTWADGQWTARGRGINDCIARLDAATAQLVGDGKAK